MRMAKMTYVIVHDPNTRMTQTITQQQKTTIQKQQSTTQNTTKNPRFDDNRVSLLEVRPPTIIIS